MMSLVHVPRGLSNSLQIDHLEINRHLKSFGWNDIEVDSHTLLLSKAFFEAD